MGALFNTILYKPLLNALIILYQYLPGQDFGIAIIVLTCLVRLLLYPLTSKSFKAQKAMQSIQPKIKEIQKKFKDKGEQGKAMMELYKKEKISPFSGCLPMLIQFPILIALFFVFRNLSEGSAIDNNLLYSFVSRPEEINTMFLGLLNLAKPSAVLAIIAGGLQFFQMKMMHGQNKDSGDKKDFSQTMQKQMLYFFPFFAIIILLKLPSAVGLYWITTTLFAIGQQYLTFKD